MTFLANFFFSNHSRIFGIASSLVKPSNCSELNKMPKSSKALSSGNLEPSLGFKTLIKGISYFLAKVIN